MRCSTRLIPLLTLTLLAGLPLASHPRAAPAAPPPSGPPGVGITDVTPERITQVDEFVGRIQSVGRVAVVSRVTAFLDQQLFADGAEVKRGQVLFSLERGPFEADVQQKAAAVAQIQATQANDQIKYNRTVALLNTPAGQRSTVDDTRAQLLADQAQVLAGQANLRASEINLAYTAITAPIDGKLGRVLVTPGNVVSPGSGTLVTLVSQDPMYVVFPVSRETLERLRDRYAAHGGVSAVTIKLRLQDGTVYDQTGKLLFVDNTTSSTTDSVLLQGLIANPFLPNTAVRQLIDGQFVTVLVQGVSPIAVLGVPRAAVLSDQQGDYVFTVGSDNIAHRTPVQLGQSTPATAMIMQGLQQGQHVVVDGIQKVRDGQPVAPAPAGPTAAQAPANAAHN